MNGSWQTGTGDFTEVAFAQLLRKLTERNYQFATFGSTPSGRHVLWRHDVDFSLHRARALARIEQELGAVGTYFVNPRCAYYNVFEPGIASILKEIAALGHVIGLHFDPAAHGRTSWDLPSLEAAVALDRSLLELAATCPVACVSWHNPDQTDILTYEHDRIGGLHNAYSGWLRQNYEYCSDSNGYWRFAPMTQVIEREHERLHLLTHPEWWTPEELSPWDRTVRCTQGRADSTLQAHERLLALAGRKIPGKPVHK